MAEYRCIEGNFKVSKIVIKKLYRYTKGIVKIYSWYVEQYTKGILNDQRNLY